MTIAEQLIHTTVRLECVLEGGKSSTGTGFFFSFRIDDTNSIPLIISNKHVIDGAKKGTFVLTKANNKGEPIIGDVVRVTLDNFESRWIKHPKTNVDLAILPIAPLHKEAAEQSIIFYSPALSEDLLATPEKIADLSGLEDITMIGYPNGIWDQKNNMPIVRRGITATNPKYDYNGLPIFIIDCACFPGSSGSPVLIFDQGSYTDSKGNLNVGGHRIILLGVLFAGPQHIAEGEIQTIEIPLSRIPISLSRIPNNLGFVVKAKSILDFRKLLLP